MSRNARLRWLIEAHHDAYLVDLFGEANSGLPLERITELRNAGLIGTNRLAALQGMDPLTLAINLGRLMQALSSGQAKKDFDRVQHLSAGEVAKELVNKPIPGLILPDRKEREAHPGRRSPGAIRLDRKEHEHEEHQEKHIIFKRPEAPSPTAHERVVSGFSPPRDPPLTMIAEGAGAPPGGYKNVYAAAIERIGAFCRGLGNIWSEDLEQWVGERWDKEQVLKVPSPGLRRKKLEILSALVLEAREKGWNANTLAARLSAETQDYGRNWRRIAQTELQALYNETVVRDAVGRWGSAGRIARTPESAACGYCRHLFLDDTGKPILWKIEDLLRNGTNVGKAQAQWQATLFPVHPRCACGTVSVPPGMYLDQHGMMNFRS